MKQPTFLLGTLLAILTVTGCSNPYSQAVDRAEEALENKRYADALWNYEQACAIARKQPDDACKAVTQLAKPAEAELFQRFKLTCEQGQPIPCIEGLARAPKSIRDTQRLLGLRVVGGTRHLATCTSTTPNDPLGRVKRARCAASVEHLVNEASYRDRSLVLHREAADSILATARVVGNQYPGAEVILFDAANLLYKRPETEARVGQARQQFLLSSAAPLRILMSLEAADGGHGDVDVCQRLQPSLGNRVRCHGSGTLVRVQLRAERSRDRMWTEEHSKRYQAGTRLVPNPAYPPAERRVRDGRRALDEAREELTLARSACTSAEREYNQTSISDTAARERAKNRKDLECDRQAARERIVNDRDSNLDDAESDLRRTPSQLEEPVYDTHYWTSRHYEWTMEYAFSLEGLGTRFSDGDTVVVKRMEQPGFPPAEIEEVRVGVRPSYRDLVAEADARVAGATLKMLTDHLTQWGQNRSKECPQELALTGPWLECQAETALWAGQEVNGQILLSRIR